MIYLFENLIHRDFHILYSQLKLLKLFDESNSIVRTHAYISHASRDILIVRTNFFDHRLGIVFKKFLLIHFFKFDSTSIPKFKGISSEYESNFEQKMS